MTDTYSSPTPTSNPSAATSATIDPHQAAQARLAALLEELKADQLKTPEPKVDAVPDISTDSVNVQRPKSGLTQSQPTVEEQIELSTQVTDGTYAQLMHKLNQKYQQGKPSLTDLLGMVKTQPAQAVVAPIPETNSTQPEPVDSAETATPAPSLPTQPKPRIVSSYLRKLSVNLKQFGRLDLASFHAAK